MSDLTRAHDELFRRMPDERFPSLNALSDFCRKQKSESEDFWQKPQDLILSHDLTLMIGDNPDRTLTDWSFSQLCHMAGVSKQTINRLSSKTASMALEETLPRSEKPLQLLTTGDMIRSVHGVAYTRLWNSELISTVRDAATGFDAPQAGCNGATGLYCGEQDLFAFLIDPTGWIEIGGEAFAPGFFVWNSEVGRRSLGIQTFWFQAVCQNHIVWDAVNVVEFSRKHTANVRDGLAEVQRLIYQLVKQRDARRDDFAKVLGKAMETKLGADAEEVAKVLANEGIAKSLATEALEIARQQGRFTIFALVDALTRLSQRVSYAGDRAEIDGQVGKLLALAS